MAETDVVQNLTEAIENATETITGKKVPSTPEGMLVAYSSLVIMAMLPIFFGSMRSVSHQKHQKVNHKFRVIEKNKTIWLRLLSVQSHLCTFTLLIIYYQ